VIVLGFFQAGVTHAAAVVMKKDLNGLGWKFGRLHDSASPFENGDARNP